MKTEYHNTETHAKEADGWDKLIGMDLNNVEKVLGKSELIQTEYEDFPNAKQTYKDEQGHIVEIWADGNIIVHKVSVYNPIFTISDDK